MKLYGYWRSTSSWRVRIALELKGIRWEYAAVNLLAGEHASPEFTAKSPAGQVPALELSDGTILTQSIAILEWLEETHPTPHLLPRDAILRARSRQIAEVINAGTQPLQNLAVLNHVEKLGGAEARAAWARLTIERGLSAVEALARKTAGRFLVGEDVTLADVLLVPQLYNADRFGCDTSALETIRRVSKNCETMDAFLRAHPDRQPDAPKPASAADAKES